MILALSCVSSQGIWLLADVQAQRILRQELWNDNDSTGLSVGMAAAFDRLFLADPALPQSFRKRDVTALYGVTGPGSFTGLRMSSAFLQGLSLGLREGAGSATGELPLRSVPTFDLYGKPVFIPLRHQKARELTRAAALAAGIEFLRIGSITESGIAPPAEGDFVVGLRDQPWWPTAEDLLRGIRANLGTEPGLRLDYGLNPKISGQRV
jgi:hypothetical protein